MKKLIRTFKQISILILAITFLGCEDDEGNLPKVVAGFTHTINVDNGVVTFINISENATNYSWDFGEGSNSTLINPVKAYPPGEYLVTLKATNVAGATEIFVDTIVISDVGAPIITLLGDTTLNINVGGVFTDPGATATDDLDGDITANIVVAGDTVDADTAGTYIITYNVSDAAGNAATQRTRTVIVAADVVAPVITLVGSETINITLGESFTDPGATATDNVDGDITANIVVAGDAVDVNTAGTYIITYNVSDASGNAATEVTRTVVVTDPDACLAETTESFAAADFNVTFQSANSATTIKTEASTIVRVANPDTNNAVNSSCYIGEFKREGGATSAYAHNKFELSTGVDLVANAGFKIKVWSPVAGAKLTLKLEGGNAVQTDKSTTVANAWEELTFDFSTAQNDTNNKSIVLFFNIETTAAATLYYDDFRLYARTGGGGGGGTPGTAAGDIAVNGGFEDGNLDGWAAYNNGGTIEAVTTQPSTGTYCAKLFASPETGLNPTLKQERKAAGTLAVGDEVKITFDYRGALTGESGAYSIQSFVEAANGVNQVVNISVDPSDTWQTYSTTYTVAAGDISGGITLEFVAICGGVPGCSSTLYLDNISVIINP
ncbi:hypothetical protein GCM10023314_14060 [Algibacter agarivorans]|uniref:PKD domain-containing protein n=1 Tax=Algibacter agarivorans TaxID=1109741 RepID=A0ABP9GH33_9FLAO